jgi:hypothetical protein
LDQTSAAEVAPVLEAVAREPHNAGWMHTLALHCLRWGYTDLWRRYHDIALGLPHLTPFNVYLRGQAKIRAGDWSGWLDREARLCNPGELDYQPLDVQHMRWTKAAWDGRENLTSQTLFVFADGGLGDCLQMLRYVPLLAQDAAGVILAVRPRCVPFAQHNVGHLATIVIRDVPHACEFQRYTWLMSQPALIGHIPTFVPFSAPRPNEYRAPADSRLHVAICWAGNTNHSGNRDDRFQSIRLADLAPLLSRDDIRWHSVQIGPWASEANAYPSLIQPTVPLYNLAQTANVLAGMDAVLTVDTSVAHLAGSLGIPTLLILSRLAEFRWGTGDTTPWYPSMYLIRQHVPGDWSAVIHALQAQLTSRRWVDLRSSLEHVAYPSVH